MSIQKKQNGQNSKERPKTFIFDRDTKHIKSITQLLIDQKQSFTVHDGTYTTSIKVNNGPTYKFVINEYHPSVFIAFKKILSDIKKNPKLPEILSGEWSRINYASKNGLKPGSYSNALNIDISAAYPYCLLNTGLISKESFDYLMKLPKFDRLPAIGMIARVNEKYIYEDGQCVSNETDRSEYYKVFYYVIQQIEDLMQWAKDVAGDNYLFHWVDGIFLKKNTPSAVLRDIEAIFHEAGYRYKYESVRNCIIERQEDMLEVSMVKNGVFKCFNFTDRNMQKNYFASMKKLAEHVDVVYGDLAPGVQRSRLIEDLDPEMWSS